MINSLRLWLLACVGISFSLQAQQADRCIHTMRGQVIDEHDQSQLSFATIAVESTGKGVIADESGSFLLKGLCPGWNVILVRHVGCAPLRDSVFVKGDLKRKFFLEHHAEQLKEARIEAKRSAQNIIQAQQIIDGEKLDQKAGLSLGDAVESESGLSSFKTGTNISKPMIHGMHSNRVVILNNGVNHQSQRWGDEHAPEIDPFTTNQIRIIKGAESIRYGSGALGGVIIVDNRPSMDTMGVRGEVSTLAATNQRLGAASAMLEGRLRQLPKLSWRVQGSLKKGGNVRTPNYYLDNTGIEERNISWDLNYHWKKWEVDMFYSRFESDIGIFSGAHIGNLTDLREAIQREQPRAVDIEGFSYDLERPFQFVLHELYRSSLSYRTNRGDLFRLTFARQFNERQEFDKELSRDEDLADEDVPEFDLNLTSHTAYLDWESPKFEWGSRGVGATAMTQENTLDGFRPFIPAYSSNSAGLYYWERRKLKKWWTEWGARYDFLAYDTYPIGELEEERKTFSSVSAQWGASYALKASQFGIALQWSMRPPAVNELYSRGLHHGVAALEYGDRELAVESLWGASLKYAYDSADWKINANLYQNYIRDFIYLRPQGTELTIRGAFPSFQWSQANVVIRGLDLEAERKLSRDWLIGGAASLLWARNLSDDEFLINMPAQRFSLFVEYQLFQGLTLFAKGQHTMEQTRAPLEIEIANPPAAYTLLSAGFRGSFKLQKQRLIYSLQVENLTNTVYRDYLDRFRYYTDQMGRNISLRLKIPFQFNSNQ